MRCLSRMRSTLLSALAGVCLFTACGGGEVDQSVTESSQASSSETRRVSGFAMREMRQLARRTCSAVPAQVLAKSLSDSNRAKSDTTPNGIALGYVRDIDISPIPLQRAAYNGCESGVKRSK